MKVADQKYAIIYKDGDHFIAEILIEIPENPKEIPLIRFIPVTFRGGTDTLSGTITARHYIEESHMYIYDFHDSSGTVEKFSIIAAEDDLEKLKVILAKLVTA